MILLAFISILYYDSFPLFRNKMYKLPVNINRNISLRIIRFIGNKFQKIQSTHAFRLHKFTNRLIMPIPHFDYLLYNELFIFVTKEPIIIILRYDSYWVLIIAHAVASLPDDETAALPLTLIFIISLISASLNATLKIATSSIMPLKKPAKPCDSEL